MIAIGTRGDGEPGCQKTMLIRDRATNTDSQILARAAAMSSDGSLEMDSQNMRKLVSKDKVVIQEVTIRPFAEHDSAQVRALFITVNRLLSPPDLRDAFEAYIEHALTEEIDRISAYYG